MKRLLALLLTLGMLLPGFVSVSAQDAETPFASGLSAPATYFDETGKPVTTIEVTEIEEEWTEYAEYSAPDAGVVYRAVHFTVTNVTDESIIIEPYDFSMVDTQGRNQSSSWVSAAEDATTPLFTEDLPLAAGESAELVLVYQMYDDIFPSLFAWQPDGGKLVLVDLQAEPGEFPAYAPTSDGTVVWSDDRMRPMAELSVTGIELDWQDYSDYYEPEVGTTYVAVDFTVNNVSGSNLIVEPYDFSLIDSEGNNNGRSYASASEESGVVLFEDDTPLAADETLEGKIVFQIPEGFQPTGLLWQPDSGIMNLINVSDMPGSTPTDGDATPVASPVGDDDAVEPVTSPSTPAADDDAVESVTSPSTPAADDADSEAPQSAVASATTANGEVVEVNGDPVPFVGIMGDEQGTISVVSTVDGYTEIADDAAVADGERVFLVTVEVETGDEGQFVDPSGFSVNLSDGSTEPVTIIESLPESEIQIQTEGLDIPANDTQQVTFAFVLEEGQEPIELVFDTGVEPAVAPIAP